MLRETLSQKRKQKIKKMWESDSKIFVLRRSTLMLSRELTDLKEQRLRVVKFLVGGREAESL